jgi:hypothetical protein
MADGELCPDNTVCLDRRCSGLNLTAVKCIAPAGTVDQAYDAATCSSLFAAGFRSAGDIGCEEGTVCANIQAMADQLEMLFVLNMVDAVLEVREKQGRHRSFLTH